MKKKLLALTIAVTSVISAATIIPPSIAVTEHNPASEGIDPNKDPKPEEKTAKYSDKDVLKLILFAQGPIAEQHPDLAKKLLKSRPKPTMPTDESFDSVIEQLQAIDPEYHQVVTEGVQKNNPLKAEKALQRLSDDLNEVYKLTQSPIQERGVTTWAWHDAHIFVETEAAAAAAVAVFEAAAIGHVAALVVAIVPAAVSYQFEFNHTSTIDRQAMTAIVSQASSS